MNRRPHQRGLDHIPALERGPQGLWIEVGKSRPQGEKWRGGFLRLYDASEVNGLVGEAVEVGAPMLPGPRRRHPHEVDELCRGKGVLAPEPVLDLSPPTRPIGEEGPIVTASAFQTIAPIDSIRSSIHKKIQFPNRVRDAQDSGRGESLDCAVARCHTFSPPG